VTAAADAATVVLVHGAWHGPWCWRHVVAGLEQQGVKTATVSLACVDETKKGDLAEDCAAVKAVLDAVAGPVVLCGHSYGGAVIGEAGDHPAVRHLVILTGFALAKGETIMALVNGEIARGKNEDHILPAIRPVGDGSRLALDPEIAVPLLYAQSPRADVDYALAHVKTQSAASFDATGEREAWRKKPSTFVVCTRDRTITPSLLRHMAKRCGRTVELDTDHSPFFSRVDETVALLAGLAKTA